jgi:hypothetical protein
MASRDEEVLNDLLKPMLSLFSEEKQVEFWQIWAKEREGVFAWMVQSGYLLWVRTHPGEKPTMALLREWMLKAKLPR